MLCASAASRKLRHFNHNHSENMFNILTEIYENCIGEFRYFAIYSWKFSRRLFVTLTRVWRQLVWELFPFTCPQLWIPLVGLWRIQLSAIFSRGDTEFTDTRIELSTLWHPSLSPKETTSNNRDQRQTPVFNSPFPQHLFSRNKVGRNGICLIRSLSSRLNLSDLGLF